MKNDMASIAREKGFYDILIQSWFCHNPIMNRPCGYCRPCKIARHNNNYTVHKMLPAFVSKCLVLTKRVKKKVIGH
jgi:7-cyano-7-deazaguanine synthase in queuosine biosynthesis